MRENIEIISRREAEVMKLRGKCKARVQQAEEEGKYAQAEFLEREYLQILGSGGLGRVKMKDCCPDGDHRWLLDRLGITQETTLQELGIEIGEELRELRTDASRLELNPLEMVEALPYES